MITQSDYLARAELYLGSDQATATAQGPRSFRTAAQAIRFAVEHAAPVSLHGARLVIGDATYTGDELARLHRSTDNPLSRRPRTRGTAQRQKRR